MTLHPRIRRALHIVVLVAVALIVSYIMIRRVGDDPGYLRALISFEGEMPFMRRAAVPLAAAAIYHLLPDSILPGINHSIIDRSGSTFGRTNLAPDEPAMLLCFSIVVAAALIGFGFTLRALSRTLYDDAPRSFHCWVAIVALGAIPFTLQTGATYYDAATLLLFTLALLQLARNNRTGYLLIFALACLNKETAPLLAIPYALYHLSLGTDRRRIAVDLTCQIIIAIAIIGALSWLLRDNPGAALTNQLAHNLRTLKPMPFELLAVWGAIAGFTFAEYSRKPRLLHSAIWMLPPLLLGMIPFGQLEELRIYYEVYPVVVLLMAHSIGRAMQVQVDTASEDAVSEGL